MTQASNSDEILTRTVRKEAQHAARSELKKLSGESDYDVELDDEDLEESSSALKFDDIIDTLKAEVADNEYDIFDLGTRLFEEANCDVSYSIYKNNQQLTTANNPFSYDKLQEEYGGGSYKIQLKLLNRNNRIFKTQTRTVAEPVRNKQKDADKTNSDMNGLVDRFNERDRENSERFMKLLEQTKQDSEHKMSEVLNAFKEANRKEEKPSFDIDKMAPLLAALSPILLKLFDKKDNSSEMITRLMESQMSNQKEQQTLMMTIMDKTNESQRALAEQFSKAIENVGDQISSIRDGGNDKALDPFKMLEMVKNAEKEGFEHYKMMQELAKEQSSSGKDKEESMVQTLIKSLAPTLMTNIVQSKQEAAQAAQVARVQAPTHTVNRPAPQNHNAQHVAQNRQPVPQNRRAVRPTGPLLPSAAINTSVAAFKPTQATTSSAQAQAKDNVKVVASKQNGVQDRSASLAKTNVNVNDSDKAGRRGNTINKPALGDTINGANSNKIKEVLFAVIIEKFLEGKTTDDNIEEVGKACVQTLVDHNLDPATFARDFNTSVLEAVINENVEFLADHKSLLYKLHAYIVEFINLALVQMDRSGQLPNTTP